MLAIQAIQLFFSKVKTRMLVAAFFDTNQSKSFTIDLPSRQDLASIKMLGFSAIFPLRLVVRSKSRAFLTFKNSNSY